MTKRKLMLVALSLCMVAILAMGGTLAYLTDDGQVTNTFTVGNVEITLDEAPVNKPEGSDEWVADDEADRVTSNEYEGVYPGAELPKDPTVHNVGDNDAYVRVQVAVNKAVLSYYDEDYEVAFKAFVNGTLDEENWTIVGTIPETETVTFVINYNDRLAAGDDTTAVFESIKVFAGWDNKEVTELGLDDGTEILILAEAIQAEGFDSMDAAWDAFAKQENP